MHGVAMSIVKNIIGKQHRAGIQAIGLVSAFTLSGMALAADWKFTAGVGVIETYTDNVALGASGARESDFITTITPTIGVKKTGARLKVDANYALQNLLYARDSARNTLYHQLNALANVELYENEVYLDTSAAITQAAISPLNATGANTSNATNNIANVRTFTLSPYWIHRFGSTATLNVRETIARITNDTNEFSNSTNNTFSAALTSGSAFGRVSWGLNLLQQNSDFQDRANVKLTTTSGSLGYLVSSRVRLTGTVGHESNSFATTTGETPGGFFWNTRVFWAPSTRTTLDIGFGHRFYGNNWSLAFKTRGPHSTWTADYSESLNTSNNQFASGASGTTLAQQSFDLSRNVLTNQVFLEKRFGTAFSWTKGKSDFRVDAFHSRKTTQIDGNTNTRINIGSVNLINNNDPFLATNNLTQVGVNGAWNWRFASNLSSNVSFGVTRNSYTDLNRTDTTSNLQIGLNRQFSSQLNGSVLLRRQNRDSDQSNADYSENALTGSINYKF